MRDRIIINAQVAMKSWQGRALCEFQGFESNTKARDAPVRVLAAARLMSLPSI